MVLRTPINKKINNNAASITTTLNKTLFSVTVDRKSDIFEKEAISVVAACLEMLKESHICGVFLRRGCVVADSLLSDREQSGLCCDFYWPFLGDNKEILITTPETCASRVRHMT